MTRIQVALVGAGSWASQAHLPALLSHQDVSVGAVVDPVLERAQALAQAHAIPRSLRSLEELLARETVDLVLIATPTETHAPLVAAALAAGSAVFCEKPLTNTVPLAADLAALAAGTHLPCTVGFSFRYAPALQALQQDIRGGLLGDPWLIELYEYNPQFHPAVGKPVGWKGDPAQAAAGALLEYGSHIIDLAAWLASPITDVHASFARVLPQARLDDIATLQLRFREPAIGLLVAGWVLSGGVPGIKIRYHGSNALGEAEVGFSRSGTNLYRRQWPDGRSEGVPLPIEAAAGWLYAHRHLADLLAVIQGQPAPFAATLPTFADGLNVQKVIDAALHATGGWVRPGDSPGTLS